MDQKSSKNDTPQIWIEADLRLAGSLDSRMMSLLRAVQQTGSINQAAKQAGLSYKGAWQMIERANNLAPKVLIATATGGAKGGGTVLTAAGQALLTLYSRLEQQHQQFLSQLNRELQDNPEVAILLKSMAMKSTATNQLFGMVSAIQAGAVNTEVCVTLKGGEQIIASLASAELDSLALTTGDDVLILIATPEIIVIADEAHRPLSARNALHGTVIRVLHDDINAEIVIRLPGGDSVVAVLTQTSADLLGLKAGIPVIAVFKSNAVLLAALPAGTTQ